MKNASSGELVTINRYLAAIDAIIIENLFSATPKTTEASVAKGMMETYLSRGISVVLADGDSFVLDRARGYGFIPSLSQSNDAVYVTPPKLNGTGLNRATDGDDTLIGNPFAETLSGLNGNDRLYGGSGSDKLDGGHGADRMIGGLGTDTYIVDNVGDRVFEAANEGTDLVRAFVSFSLVGQAIENLTLMGSSNVNATGNSGANIIFGNSGNNIINGATNVDIMVGRLGNDTYYVDAKADKITEASGQGTDTVYASTSYDLAAGVSVEKLQVATPTAVVATLVGNEYGQAIIGGDGSNVINGRGGNDKLTGGGGNDSFNFDHTLSVAGNVDHIADYANTSGNNDTMRLDDAIFTKLTIGKLALAAFRANATGTAADDDDRIIYETDTGKLFYDADGKGGGASIQFAVIDNFASLTGSMALKQGDFLIY